MSEYDGRAGSSTDFTPKVTATGTMTSGHELHAADVKTTDSPAVADAKINAYRNTYSSGAKTAAGDGGVGHAIVGLFLGFLLLATLLFFFIQPRIAAFYGPATVYLKAAAFEKTPAQSAKLGRSAEVADFSARFDHLYRPGTDLSAIFSKCGVASCTKPDHAAVQAFKQFAVNPATYNSDVCTVIVKGKYGDVRSLKEVEWSLLPSKNPLWTHECVRKDIVLVEREFRHAQSQAESYANYTTVGLLGGIPVLFLLLYRRRKQQTLR